jgi:hypothetical protein
MALDLDNIPYDPDILYDYPMVELTQSAVDTFLQCRMKYVLKYLMLLKRPGINLNLLVGKAVHKALEILLDPECTVENAHEKCILALTAVDQIFEDELLKNLMPPNDRTFERARAQAHACVRSWWISVGMDFGYKVLATEARVRCTPESTIDSPLEERMAGQLDGLLADLDTGTNQKLLETKTKKTLTGVDWISGLGMDLQALWYITIGLKRLDMRIQKFVYNVIGKPQHTAKLEFEPLTERMFSAMIGDPDKYFTYPEIMIDADALDSQWKNWKRTVFLMDTMTGREVTQRTNSCHDWFSECEYYTLCSRCADPECPKSILDMPESNMYVFGTRHEELEEN